MPFTIIRASAVFAVATAILVVAVAQTSAQSVTLFSRNKYRTEQLKNCITFVERKDVRRQQCDVIYGSLWAGDDLDWFNNSGSQGDRSVIRDLGAHSWSDKIYVPVVTALPKLKPGERRNVTVDVSGADGTDGAPGAPGRNADGSEAAPAPRPSATPARPKNDGKPKIDPMFVKGVVGHIYVVHVVNDSQDYYALFRVDELVRGDRVVVSWKLIDAPSEAAK
jgi:hypothetical protein